MRPFLMVADQGSSLQPSPPPTGMTSVCRMLLQLAPIRFPHVDIEADLRHVIGEKLLDLRFIPGDAGDGNHLLQKSDRFFTAVVDLLHKRLADTRTHLTSPKKSVAERH